MICNKCGKENENGVNFCVSCGNSLTEITQIQPKTTSNEVKKSNNKYVTLLLDNLNNLKNYLLKPLESISNKNTEDLKNVAITGGILTVLMTLVNLIMTMVSSLRSVSMDWTGKISYSIDFSNLGDLNYLEIIFKNLIIYAITMLTIAGIFFIGSLIVKKDIKYPKFLSIVFIATVPFFIGNVVLSTILSFIYNPLAVIASIITTIYSISIFAHLVNSEIKLENMTKIYYNAACYSTIVIVIYFIIVRIVFSAVSSISNILGGF